MPFWAILRHDLLRASRAKQGKSDPDSNWAKARYNWVTYLLVRFGVLTAAELQQQFPDGIPDWANRKKTGELTISQVASFDGSHKKQASS